MPVSSGAIGGFESGSGRSEVEDKRGGSVPGVGSADFSSATDSGDLR